MRPLQRDGGAGGLGEVVSQAVVSKLLKNNFEEKLDRGSEVLHNLVSLLLTKRCCKASDGAVEIDL